MSAADIRTIETAPILLADYQDRTLRHILDGGGLVTQARIVDEGDRDKAEQRHGVRGFGAWRDVGLFRSRRRVFIAIYGTAETLVLQVGGKGFQWPDNALSARRTNVFPGVKRFLVHRGLEKRLDLVYRYVDQETWPDNGDIFSYVERATRSPGTVVRTIHFWAAYAAGQDVLDQAFVAELDSLARAADGGGNG